MPAVYIAATFFYLGSLSSTREKKVWRLWAPPKNCSTKGGDFDLKYFGEEVVQGKKMLFQVFIWSFNGWLVIVINVLFFSLFYGAWALYEAN